MEQTEQLTLTITLSVSELDLIHKTLYNAYLKNISYQDDAIHDQNLKMFCHYVSLERKYKICMNKLRLPNETDVFK